MEIGGFVSFAVVCASERIAQSGGVINLFIVDYKTGGLAVLGGGEENVVGAVDSGVGVERAA